MWLLFVIGLHPGSLWLELLECSICGIDIVLGKVEGKSGAESVCHCYFNDQDLKVYLVTECAQPNIIVAGP
jgi:hypothetical protein